MAFASRKSRMRAPHHRRTEEIGACLADPFANGEGRSERYVHHPRRAQAAGGIDPSANSAARHGAVSIQKVGRSTSRDARRYQARAASRIEKVDQIAKRRAKSDQTCAEGWSGLEATTNGAVRASIRSPAPNQKSF